VKNYQQSILVEGTYVDGKDIKQGDVVLWGSAYVPEIWLILSKSRDELKYGSVSRNVVQIHLTCIINGKISDRYIRHDTRVQVINDKRD